MKIYIAISMCILSVFSFAQSIETIAEMEMKTRFNANRFQPEDLMDNPEIVDVTRYDLTFNFNDLNNNFYGISKIYATALEPVNSITLDADNNLQINEVKEFGTTTIDYIRNSGNITVNLSETKQAGEEIIIEISYQSSYDEADALYRQITESGNVIISTLSEPFGASSWWIGVDNLKDKADEVNMYISHPQNLKAGSNGSLQSVEQQDTGDVITHWQHNYPIPAYLISVAVTQYVAYNNEANIDGTIVPVINYVYPNELNDEVMQQLDAVPSYMEFFSTLIEDYPYKNEKYGHCQWEWGGGMEHATMSSQVHFGTSLTAHELAHQWFGDKITCGTWSDIWLNEGFAVYFEGLLRRHLYGEEFFNDWKQYRGDFAMSQPGGSVYIPANEATTSSRIFSSRLSYNKAGMVLHMLRYTLGDDDFYQAIRNYLADPNLAFGFAVTTDLQTHFETQSGRDLDEFFADWVYGEGYAIFNMNLAYEANNNAAVLTVNQSQSTNTVDFFETDFDILLTGTNGESELRRFSLSENGQTFNITDIPFALASYTFNPNYDILAIAGTQTLGTENIAVDSALTLQLYPNPATTSIYLMHFEEIKTVEIYNAEGKLVLQKDINDSAADIFIESLATGTYFLKAITNSGVETKKFVKK